MIEPQILPVVGFWEMQKPREIQDIKDSVCVCLYASGRGLLWDFIWSYISFNAEFISFLWWCCLGFDHHVFHEVTHLDWNLIRLPSFSLEGLLRLSPSTIWRHTELKPTHATTRSQLWCSLNVLKAVCMKYMATYKWEDSSHQFTVFDSLGGLTNMCWN